MAAPADVSTKVVPAQLSYLAIYNPTLARGKDVALNDQIVFWFSKESRARRKASGNDDVREEELHKDEEDKQRQVGLAQGMVEFARNFSNGEPVDCVETEKSRLVLFEPEQDWWILASIDLTRLPSTAFLSSHASSADQMARKTSTEYSSREVRPPMLLVADLKRAYRTFLLHNGHSLEDIFNRHERSKFCSTMARYWTKFAQTWDVLLHGNPAVDMYGGIKLAAGGELGVGVGEEEWGSGEREVLEDFSRKTEGLVDMMVSRYGEPAPSQQNDTTNGTDKKKAKQPTPPLEPWLGTGQSPGPSDGVVFSGIGNVTRSALRDISQWIDSVYTFGEHTYGIKDSPRSERRRRRKRNDATPTEPLAVSKATEDQTKSKPSEQVPLHAGQDQPSHPPGIPRPIVSSVGQAVQDTAKSLGSKGGSPAGTDQTRSYFGNSETWTKYLTLGLSSTWTKGDSPDEHSRKTPNTTDAEETPRGEQPPLRHVDPAPDVDRVEELIQRRIQQENSGYFIVGLQGDMNNDDIDNASSGDSGDESWNRRIFLRTLYIETTNPLQTGTPGVETANKEIQNDFELLMNPQGNVKTHPRLRVVVYVHRPFIFTFLFNPQTSSLTLTSFYQNLHTYFAPLYKPLSNSTAPTRVAAHIAAASHPYTTTVPSSGPNTQPIFDFVYDPQTLTVHTSLPNIPDPGYLQNPRPESLSIEAVMDEAGWDRVEAINVHSAILDTVKNTQNEIRGIERTGKTSRGWWVVWMRLPPSRFSPATLSQRASDSRSERAVEATEDNELDPHSFREAFLVRRARDALPVGTKSGSSARNASGTSLWRIGMGFGTSEKMGGAAAGWGPKGLAEGIGIDTRRYIEGLLSLNR